MAFNFKDFSISYKGHPRYNDLDLIEDDPVRVILQKYEMVLFTNKGDVFGDLDFGCDLEYLLHETKVDSTYVETIILTQIDKYIEEMKNTNYSLNVKFYDDPERFQDWMEINFQINDYEVYVAVG